MVYSSSPKKIITHCTTVHPRYDTRIFHKMCTSLSEHYSVNLIVADGDSTTIQDNIRIIDLGKINSRTLRLLHSLFVFPFKILQIKSDLYHLHDPELIFSGLVLKFFRKNVIYDIHESYSEDILNKYWINKHFRKFIANIYQYIENFSTYYFNLNICATDYIKKNIQYHAVTINNFPLTTSEKFNYKKPTSQKIPDNYFLYIGAISFQRGIIEIIESSIRCRIKLIICGSFENEEVENRISNYFCENIIYLGQVNFNEANYLMQNAIAGFVLFHPGPNHNYSLPNKLFEYMSNCLPIICSDFDLWKSIIQNNECGFCIDPFDNYSLDFAVIELRDNFKKRELIKLNCKETSNLYNWESEKQKLFEAYNKILN
jgi:glycosyltransferase involved in cell wall biosynthesis